MEENKVTLRLLTVRRYPLFLQTALFEGMEDIEEEILEKLETNEELTEDEEDYVLNILYSKYTCLYNGKNLTELQEDIYETACENEYFAFDVEEIINQIPAHGKFSLITDMNEENMALVSPLENSENDFQEIILNALDFDEYFIYLHKFFDSEVSDKIFKHYKRNNDVYSPLDEINDINELDVLYNFEHMYLCCVTNAMDNIETQYYVVLPEYVFDAKMFSYVKDIDNYDKTNGQIYKEIVKQVKDLVQSKSNDNTKSM